MVFRHQHLRQMKMFFSLFLLCCLFCCCCCCCCCLLFVVFEYLGTVRFQCSEKWNFKQTIYFDRSGHQRRSVKKDILRNFAKFTGKNLYQGLFFNKIKLQPKACNFIKKESLAQVPVNISKFQITLFLQNTSGRLLLFRANQRKSKSSSKEYVTWERINFEQSDKFSENHKPIKFWLWLVYKFTENKFQKRYHIAIDKKVFELEVFTPKYFYELSCPCAKLSIMIIWIWSAC